MVMVVCISPLSTVTVPSPFQVTVKPSGSAMARRGTIMTASTDTSFPLISRVQRPAAPSGAAEITAGGSEISAGDTVPAAMAGVSMAQAIVRDIRAAILFFMTIIHPSICGVCFGRRFCRPA